MIFMSAGTEGRYHFSCLLHSSEILCIRCLSLATVVFTPFKGIPQAYVNILIASFLFYGPYFSKNGFDN